MVWSTSRRGRSPCFLSVSAGLLGRAPAGQSLECRSTSLEGRTNPIAQEPHARDGLEIGMDEQPVVGAELRDGCREPDERRGGVADEAGQDAEAGPRPDRLDLQREP